MIPPAGCHLPDPPVFEKPGASLPPEKQGIRKKNPEYTFQDGLLTSVHRQVCPADERTSLVHTRSTVQTKQPFMAVFLAGYRPFMYAVMNVFRHRGDILERYGYWSGFLEISLSMSVRERYRFMGDESLLTAS